MTNINLLKEYHLNIPLNEDDEDIDIDSLDGEGDVQPKTKPESPDDVNASLQSINPENMQGVDVTDLVNKQDEVLQKFNDIIGKMNHFSDISKTVDETSKEVNSLKNDLQTKIDSFGKELEKRLPTDKEKLRLQSLNSYPYNIPIDDYFINTGRVDMNKEEEDKKADDFILKVKDIEDGYNEFDVKNSF